MNIHEYQAKDILRRYGVPVPAGNVAFTPAEAEQVARDLKTDQLVVKAQIHAGGRGKAGGVKLCKTPEEAGKLAKEMLGKILVTHQTGPAGKEVKKVLVAAATGIKKELYLSILVDRAVGRPSFLASTEGGVDIETVAANTPEKIVREAIDPATGMLPYQARKIAFGLGLGGEYLQSTVTMLLNLYKAFVDTDASMIEINPLIISEDNKVIALDAKIGFDDNALFRHKDILAMRDLNEEDPREVEASKHNLNYIGLDGNIACMVNGAGLAMATMDIIKHYGGNPANFLDVGGGATQETVTEAFKILCSDKNVNGILVNIFGGIMKCDVIATGIIGAVKEVHLNVPLVVRLEGTNVELGKKLLKESGLPIITADGLADAAQKIVAAAKKAA
ncbi:MAG: Succinate--CoA ligase [ADP-forming] subunit beta [Verrucomicrobiae bacterium]|nr:Succinate--CoA ligase [ADP-forming] subunit beta [Verrucomicrobiae bacterium]